MCELGLGLNSRVLNILLLLSWTVFNQCPFRPVRVFPNASKAKSFHGFLAPAAFLPTCGSSLKTSTYFKEEMDGTVYRCFSKHSGPRIAMTNPVKLVKGCQEPI